MRRARPWAAGVVALGLAVAAARAPLACAPAHAPESPRSDALAAEAATAAPLDLARGLSEVEAPLTALGFARVGEATGALPLGDGGLAEETFEAPVDPAHDRCLRAAFVASERVAAEVLVRAVARGRSEGRAGLVGEGPACARRGEALRLVVRGPAGARVALAWHAPAPEPGGASSAPVGSEPRGD